ncbi:MULTISPECIES: restriction endonuclease [Mumia]|uniref:restriction endonuclease n=1 Tax=Mumia TaxID=1546255 RepID=UPI00141ED25C|nr:MULTISPECIES: restriction endonuclease [unclassified Mumia]QMW64693.1 restriction endonuclease [Mumia sp. ZJ1417]
MSELDLFHVARWEDAEENAARWLRHWGYHDALASPGGADGGIDVVATHAAAQVKFQASQAGRPEIQRLVGAVGRASTVDLFFFCGSSFTAQAISYADANHVALFTYDITGAVQPVNGWAVEAMERVSVPDADDGEDVYVDEDAGTAAASGLRFGSWLAGVVCLWVGSSAGLAGVYAAVAEREGTFLLPLVGLFLIPVGIGSLSVAVQASRTPRMWTAAGWIGLPCAAAGIAKGFQLEPSFAATAACAVLLVILASFAFSHVRHAGESTP